MSPAPPFSAHSDRLLSAIACSLADPILVIDSDGRYLNVLGGAAREHYDSCDYLLGRSLHEVLPASIADDFLVVVRRAIADNRVQTIEYSLSSQDCDGNRRDGPDAEQWFEGRVSPILGAAPGAKPCVAWVVVNITQRKRLEAELKRLAATDELTGLINRRVFLRSVDEEIQRSLRYGHAMQLAILDLDQFKRVNDTYGHPVGDQVLRHIGALLARRVRKTDVLGRIGGEEFALCMPCTSPQDAFDLIAELRDILHGDPPAIQEPNAAPRLLPVTFSAGLTSLERGDRSCIDLFVRADSQLYRAKEEGRDCIRAGGR